MHAETAGHGTLHGHLPLLGGAIALLGVALLVAMAPDAEATHFRAGTMQWHHLQGELPETPVPPPPGVPDYNNLQPTVNMTMKLAFRASYPWPQAAPQVVGTDLCLGSACLGSINWGDATSSSNYDAIVTQYNATLDMVFLRIVQDGTVSDLVHEYPFMASSQYTISWGGCCRLEWNGPMNQAHVNNPQSSSGQNWRLETTVDLTRSNYSPTAVLIPIRVCPQSGWCHFQTFFNDPDNDTLTFRLSTSAEATGGGTFYQPGPCPAGGGSPGCGSPGTASIDNNGTVHWFVTGATIRAAPWMTYYSMQIMIEDQSTKTPLDYFIRLDPPQPPPICDPAGQTVVAGRPAYWNSTGEGNVWAAPGGNPPSGVGNSGSTTYDEPGTYYVTVTNSGGSVDCVIDVVWPPPACAPQSQTVLIQQTASLTASSGPSSNYSWQAPYGIPSSQPVAPAPAGAAFSTKYDMPGTFTVTVTNDGLTGDCVVVVPAPACSPVTQQVTVNVPVTLSATGGDGTYAWRAPMGGTPSAGAGGTFSLQFPYDARYPVDLTSHGLTVRCFVDVVTPPPLTSFAWAQSQSGCGPHPVAFADLTTAQAPLVSWRWEFGDGGSSTEQNPVHEYRDSGTYTVSLTVVDSNNHATTTSQTRFFVGAVGCPGGTQDPEEARRAGASPQDGRDPALAGVDSDGDGTPDGTDACPDVFDAQADLDKDGWGDACDLDLDGDGVRNVLDNCVATPNGDQGDMEGDGQGDACDFDNDGDGVFDADDACPLVADDQADADQDGTGDACESAVPPAAAGTVLGGQAGGEATTGVQAPASLESGVPPAAVALAGLAGAAVAATLAVALWRRRAK